MIYSYLNQHNIFFIILSFCLIIISCKEKPLTVDDITDKYVEFIKKDIITFDDGTSFTMDINDSTYIYYLVRHAEKDTIPKNDPRLTDVGYNRAAKLYNILRGTKLDAVYSTLYMRTIETVDSIANAKGMPIMPYTPQDFKTLHSSIKDSTDFKRILISGHSNTTPVLANYLSKSSYFNAAFDESDYDNFIVIIDRGNDDIDLIALQFKP